MNNHDIVRYIGNTLTITGYFVLLYKDPFIGAIMKMIGFACVIFSCYFLKLWDVIIVMSIFFGIDLSYAYKIWRKHNYDN